jgi:hypothetical protein
MPNLRYKARIYWTLAASETGEVCIIERNQNCGKFRFTAFGYPFILQASAIVKRKSCFTTGRAYSFG